MTTQNQPKLLKSRQFHSRIFAVLAIIALCVIAPLMPAAAPLRTLMLWLGYALVIVGAFGRVYCSCFIGGRKNKSVIRSGPFSVVRNPLYVFSFLATIGIGLQSGMVTLAVLLPLSFILYYPFVVKKEEAFLRHKFGADYDAYTQEVPRWIPNLKLWREPEEAECMPKFIRRTIGDAFVFFLPLPMFMLIGYLQAAGLLPVWLNLW